MKAVTENTRTVKANAALKATKDMGLVALFTLIMAVCSWISIPTAIPFTMQTFGVFLTISIFGGKRGTMSICLYLILGMLGAPVFANGAAGMGALFGVTGGYLMSWAFAGPIMWLIETVFGRKNWTVALGMAASLFVCYAMGTAWFMVVYTRGMGQMNLQTALSLCVTPFIIPDLAKLAMAMLAQKVVSSKVK